MRALLLIAAAALVVTACEPHTVSVGFTPEVGDRFRYRSAVTSEVTRTVEGEVEHITDDAVLETVERVVAIGDEGVRVEVTVSRDDALPRTFEAVLDRASRLTAIDLVEGVPAEALGLELGTELPADVASPPSGPLEPGTRWTIAEPVTLEGVAEPAVITGAGRIEALGVEDGTEVAIAVVDLVVPVRSVVETDDGRVTLFGSQTTSSETAYALHDGSLWRDHTVITGTVSLIIEPPSGIDVQPVEASIVYEVETRTRRSV